MDFSLNDHQKLIRDTIRQGGMADSATATSAPGAPLPFREAWTKRSPPVLREEPREIGDLFSAAVLRTIVAQLRLARDYSVDAGDGAEIFVDGPKVMVRHVFINGPGHDLQKIAIKWMRHAA